MTDSTFENIETDDDNGATAAPAVRIPITVKHMLSPPDEVGDLRDASEPAPEGSAEDAYFVITDSTTMKQGEHVAANPYRNFNFQIEVGGETQGNNDDGDDDIIFDRDGDLLPPNTPVDPLLEEPVSLEAQNKTDDAAEDDSSTADGPHQGRRDIGGYVPSTVIAPTLDAGEITSPLDTNVDADRGPTGIMQSVEPLPGALPASEIASNSSVETDGTLIQHELSDVAQSSGDHERKYILSTGGDFDAPLEPATGDPAEETTLADPAALNDLPDANATSGQEFNMKGVSWFGFETTAASASTGSSGHYTQIVWADTRYDSQAAPGDLKGDVEFQTSPDMIEGTAGSDVLYGGEGNDDVHAYGGSDFVYANGGNDYVNGGNGSDEIFGGSGHDTLNGGANVDTLEGGTGDDQLSGGAHNDRLFGGADDDVLRGGQGVDWIDGGAGADIHVWEHGDSGEDNVYGFELGVDTFDFSTGFFDTGPGDTLNDVLSAVGDGSDTQLLANTSWGGLQVLARFHDVDANEMQARIDNGTILETSVAIDGGPGGFTPEQRDPYAQELLVEKTDGTGNAPSQEIDVPDQAFVGVAYIGTDDADLMVGAENDDVFFAGGGQDIVSGAGGNDQLYGEGDGDTLFGGAGDDFLSGGDGNDRLTGGDGADVFNFETSGGFVHNPGSDIIIDFELGVDSLAFEDGFFDAEPGDELADNLIAVQDVGGTQLLADMSFWNLRQIAFVENVDAADLQQLIDSEMVLG